MDHAAGRRPCERHRVSDQHLRRGRARCRDHDRSGAERNDGSRHAAAGNRADRRTHEAAVPIRANRQGVGRVRSGAREAGRPAGGKPPDTFPGTPDHPYWQFIRRLYFYDPAPTLRQLQVPTLALFGELDNNIVAEKNRAAWEAALKAGGNRDYTLRILPKANHLQLEAKVGSNAEMASLQRFVPAYFTTIRDWLAKRVRGFPSPRSSVLPAHGDFQPPDLRRPQCIDDAPRQRLGHLDEREVVVDLDGAD